MNAGAADHFPADLHGAPLCDGWRFRRFAPGSHHTPDSLDALEGDWLPATVPGTVASSLRDTGTLDFAALENLDDADYWFGCNFDFAHPGASQATLVCHGLATISEIWLNGALLGTSESMFVRSTFDITERLARRNALWICFRALNSVLNLKRPRGRWRTALVENRNLRFVRTTLLGRMPSWCPPLAPVGPWRKVELVVSPSDRMWCSEKKITTSFQGTVGWIDVNIELQSPAGAGGQTAVSLEVAGQILPLDCASTGSNGTRVTGRVRVDGIEPWWPHSHGHPRLYPLTLHITQAQVKSQLALDRIGFRSIELTGPPGPDFALTVNAQTIFCRGTCWTPVDPLTLVTTPAATRTALEQARDAGMNMLRISGSMVYEDRVFYEICDELGILVWQDFMFATLDYPIGDAAFMTCVRSEVEQFLQSVQSRACLAILCGNSEGQQQPAMLGLSPENWASPLFDELIPALCHEFRPDVPYWPSTPSGGELPFHVSTGTSHYFGVGAYRRPLADALLARPRFMTECLGLSNVGRDSGTDQTPASRIPQDRGADWNFRDITQHYVATLFGNQAAGQARQDPELDAALCRATSADLMHRIQTMWRDPASGCHGALVWLHRDPWDCAGWGVVDADGRPKSAYFGLKRAWSPVAVSIVDDGLNGLRVVIFNDRETRLEADLEIRLMRINGIQVQRQITKLVVLPRSSFSSSVDALIGGYIDSSHAYRFGPRGFDIALARIHFYSGTTECEVHAIHLPLEFGLLPSGEIGLEAQWKESKTQGEILLITTEQFAQTVVLDVQGGIPNDNYFHLVPGMQKCVEIRGHGDVGDFHVSIGALNTNEKLSIAGRAGSASALGPRSDTR